MDTKIGANIRIWLLMVPFLFMLVACERGQSDFVRYNDLELKLEVDRSSCIQIGESVHIRFTTSNVGKSPIVIESQNMPVLDIGVRNSLSQTPDASWSSQNPDKVSHRVEWKPGESKTLELTWTVPKAAYAPGHMVSIAGFLSIDSKIVTSTGVNLCIGIPFESM